MCVCLCVCMCFTCLRGRLCAFAFLHVNLIIGKAERGDMVGGTGERDGRDEGRKMKETRSFLVLGREEKKKTIPAQWFP